MEIPKKSFNFKKFFLIVLFFISIFLVISCIVYKASAADGTSPDSVQSVVKLDFVQFGTIVSLLTLTAVSCLFNGIVMLTRKG